MPAPSSQSSLCFCLHISFFRNRLSEKEKKIHRRREEECATVNVGPLQIARPLNIACLVQHRLQFGEPQSILFLHVAIRMSNQSWEGKQQSKRPRCYFQMLCLRLSLTHRLLSASFALTATHISSGLHKLLFLTWTCSPTNTQCYGNDHIPEQCRVPDPAVRRAINCGVSAKA